MPALKTKLRWVFAQRQSTSSQAAFLQLVIKHACRYPSNPALCEISLMKCIFCDNHAQPWASIINEEN